ncbi:MAG: tetratricopeptide repeat protein [Candidatus Paceibacterota bacterium]
MSLVNKKAGWILALIIISFFIYSFNLNNQLFWDDDDWIIGNNFVHDLSHVKEIFSTDILAGFGLNSNYYRPLLLLSFTFNYVVHGIEPLGYHLVSNGFHILNGILIFFLLLGVFKKRLPAFLAALIFLIHPLQTEAVTYISGRGDPMSVFFMLLSLWIFTKAQSLSRKTSKFWLLTSGSIISFILAILSRETAVLFPLLFMIFYISFLTKAGFWKSIWQSFVKAIPYFVISGIYGILRLTVFNFQNTLNFYSQANEYTEHLSYRLFTFGHALMDYFRLIFAPLGLHMERDLAIKTSLFQWPVWLAVLILAGIIYVVIKKFKTNRIWFFAWAWFFVALGPVSGIIPINAIIYEHWLYLPLIGFLALAGFYLDKLLSFAKNGWRMFLWVLLIGYLTFFGVASIKRNIAWGNPTSFYEDILRYNPESVRIINNLANLYSERGEFKKAEEAYMRALSINEGAGFAQPYYNLGNLYRDRGDISGAVEQYKKAIEVDPGFIFAYQNLAVVYVNQNELANAALTLEDLKKIKPNDPVIYYNLAVIYLAQQEKDLSLENIQSGIKLSGSSELNAAFEYLLSQPEFKVE